MALFGTFTDQDGTELAPGGFQPSTLESGHVVDVGANYGTEGGLVRYRWQNIRFKPFVPDPYKPMFAKVRAFPPRRHAITTVQNPMVQSGTRPVTYTPPGIASVNGFD